MLQTPANHAPYWALILIVAIGLVACAPEPSETVGQRALEAPADGYVTSKACRACHPAEYESWHKTYHRRMTQVAGPEAIEAQFDDRTLETRGVIYTLTREGDRFFVTSSIADWKEHGGKREVVQVTGSHHMQVFWLGSPGAGRNMELLPLAYRVREKRWIPLDAAFLTPPGTGQQLGLGRWNKTCTRCHTTHTRPRAEHDWDTHVAELGIACEACHGPAEEHVRANRSPLARYEKHFGRRTEDTIVDPQDLDHRRSTEVCGQCHGVTRFANDEDRERFFAEGFQYRPGQVLGDCRDLVMGGDDRYWPDGMIRVGGREYNGLVRTACFTEGTMSCLSCHEMHPDEGDERPLETWRDGLFGSEMQGDRACTQCHDGFSTPAEITAHTHHTPDAIGSACYDCHMPHTSYGLLKATRSHEVSSPNARVALETGRPNACNLCHLDRTLAWTAERLEEWYGQPAPKLTGDIARTATGPLLALKGDAGQRVLIAWAFGWEPARRAAGSDWMLPYIALLMNDPYRAVRFVSDQSLRVDSTFEDLDYDFMDDEDERYRAVLPVYRAWEQGAVTRDTSRNRELIFDRAGRLNSAIFDRLLEERDRRSIVLGE